MKTKIMQFVGVVSVVLSLTIVGAFAQDSGGGNSGDETVVTPGTSGDNGNETVLTGPVLPIGSQDELRNYALSKVVRGSRYVSAPSIDWNYDGSVTHTNVTGAGAENVLDKLFSADFRYRLINPDDQIRGYVYLYDKNDNLLFFGYSEFTAKDLETSKPQYSIWIQNVSMLDNVASAEVLALDQDGKTAKRYSIEIDDSGHLLFQPWMAGAPNGILVVRYKDGSLVKYDLSNPSGQIPGTTSEWAGWKIDGHYVYKKSEKLIVVKIIETWMRPTAIVTVGANEAVAFDVIGLVQMNGSTTFERPLSVVFEQVDGPWAGAGNLDQNQPSKIVFPAPGTYRIRFEWKNFGQPNTLYTGPDDGGKG